MECERSWHTDKETKDYSCHSSGLPLQPRVGHRNPRPSLAFGSLGPATGKEVLGDGEDTTVTKSHEGCCCWLTLPLIRMSPLVVTHSSVAIFDAEQMAHTHGGMRLSWAPTKRIGASVRDAMLLLNVRLLVHIG